MEEGLNGKQNSISVRRIVRLFEIEILLGFIINIYFATDNDCHCLRKPLIVQAR